MSLTFPRAALFAALRDAARRPPPVLLAGPPGAGKTAMFVRLRDALRAEGGWPVFLDVMGAASSPEHFVRAALDALPADLDGRAGAQRAEAQRLRAAGRDEEEAAVRAVFALWASVETAGGRPVVLLLDEVTEIRALAYFPGLREVDEPFGAALRARRGPTVLATSFPTAARRHWPDLAVLAVPPLTADEMRPELRAAGLRTDPDLVLRVTGGWPRYARVIVDGLLAGRDVATAWSEGMAPGGPLEQACRHTYETLLLRSRGYGMSKAVLGAVAAEEGLNLTALVGRLGRTPGAVRDYLGWLLAVDALKATRKRYVYVDALLRVWVRLYCRGVVPTTDEVAAAGRELVAAAPADTAPRSGAGREDSERVMPPAPAAREEGLIEID
jgi:hypothetical protein